MYCYRELIISMISMIFGYYCLVIAREVIIGCVYIILLEYSNTLNFQSLFLERFSCLSPSPASWVGLLVSLHFHFHWSLIEFQLFVYWYFFIDLQCLYKIYGFDWINIEHINQKSRRKTHENRRNRKQKRLRRKRNQRKKNT